MRRIMVGVKRVVDYNVRVRVKPDNTGVITEGVKMSLNPFDEIALEEALRIKEKGLADEVLAVSIGVADTQQQLRTALAMGADRAILVQTDAAMAPLSVAKVFQKIAEAEQPFLTLLGKQAIDEDNGQTAQMLAALLDRPQATSCSKVDIADGKATVTREVDSGLETLEVDLPAVLSVDLRLNEPRYVKLPDIMKAKKKPLDIKSVADYGVAEGAAGVTVDRYGPLLLVQTTAQARVPTDELEAVTDLVAGDLTISRVYPAAGGSGALGDWDLSLPRVRVSAERIAYEGLGELPARIEIEDLLQQPPGLVQPVVLDGKP